MKANFKTPFHVLVGLIFFVLLAIGMPLKAQNPGNALHLDGSNDLVVLPTSLTQAVSNGNAITVMYWFKGTKVQSAVRFQNGGNYIVAGHGSAGSEKHILSNDGGSTAGVAVGASAVDGKWHHIAFTWERNTVNGFRSYLDGQLVEQRTSSNNALPNMGAVAGYLGCYNGNTEFSLGSFDEVKIFNVAKSQVDLQQEMISSIASNFPSNLLVYYKFNQGNAGVSNTGVNTLVDATTNNYTGTLTNFALNGLTSNWVESYAMVVPKSAGASLVGLSGFTANWELPVMGVVDSLILEVSSNASFTLPIVGSPFKLAPNAVFKEISGLISGTYYYRLRANKSSQNGLGAPSQTIEVRLDYTPPGNALNFDGSNDYVSIPHKSSVHNLTKFTLETWVYWTPTSSTDVDFICGKGGLEVMEIHTAGGAGANGLRFIPRPGVFIDVANCLLPNKWNHIAFVCDPSTATAKTYINGMNYPFKLSNGSLSTALVTNTGNFNIGRRLDNSNFFKGAIDEFRIWSTTRSASEILQDMAGNVPLNSTGLVAYYDFDNGIKGANNTAVLTLKDLKNEDNSGTLTNFTLTGTTSNWVESYANVFAGYLEANNITETSFTARWTAPLQGIVNGYLIDVSLYADFSSVITGSPFSVSGNTFTKLINGLRTNTNYYYRVRTENTSMTGVGAAGVTQEARTLNLMAPPGNCLAMDGSSDYVSLPVSSGINNQFTNNRITVETWVFLKSHPTGSAAPALITEGWDGNIKFSLHQYQGGIYAGFHYGSWTDAGFTDPLPLNRWVHIAATYDKENINLYINGELVATKATTLDLPAGNDEWRFGRRWDLNDCINGYMDEVKIYNEALTQNQIILDMRDTGSVMPENLVLYYDFDQGLAGGANAGTTLATDRSGNRRNGTLNNFALTGNVSNWISSYAMVLPRATAATNITTTGFTANWQFPVYGSVNGYFLDVSTTPDFKGTIVGSPFTLDSSIYSKSFSGLFEGRYYYRVRGNHSSFANQGGASNVIEVLVPYTPPGNALKLNLIDNNDYVSIPSTQQNNFSINQDFTVEVWVKAPVNQAELTNVDNDIIEKWNQNGGGGYPFVIRMYNQTHSYNGRITGARFNGSSGIGVTSTTRINDNRWHHVTMVKQSNSLKLYIDGALEDSVFDNLTGNTTNPFNLYIGGRNGWYNNYSGSVDELKIYNTALTSMQIKADMRDTSAILPANLMAYYNFDEGVNSSVNTHIKQIKDKSIYANHGTLSSLLLTGNQRNFIKSYAMVVPTAMAGSNITNEGFTANWLAPTLTRFDYYKVDVSTTTDYSGPITGSPFIVSKDSLSLTLAGLKKGYYYYRVSAIDSTSSLEAASSLTEEVLVPYEYSGNAIDFSGVNVITVPAPNNLINSFTMEGWVYLKAYNGVSNLFAYGFDNGQVGNGIGLYAMEAGDLYVQYPEIGGFYPGYKMPLNTWVHLALTRTGNIARVYVNGVQLSITNGTGPKGPSAEIRLGSHNGIRYFKGRIDEFRFWNYARTSEQLYGSMKLKLPGNTAGLLRYFDFDRGVSGANNTTSNIVYDLTPNATHGTLHNFALNGTSANWVESYAMVVPEVISATAIAEGTFTANFKKVANGIAHEYLVDVSSTADFVGIVQGSPFVASATDTSKVVTGLLGGKQYFRVRANNTEHDNQGGYSNSLAVDIPYTPPGNAISFDGINDFARSNGTTVGNFGTSNFTIEYWIKTTDAGAYHITKRGGCGGGSFWSIGHGVVGQGTTGMYIELNNGGSNPVVMQPTLPRPINDNRWHHIALVREGVKLSFYYDGELVEAKNGAGIANPNNGGYLYLGASSCNNLLDGSLDEIRLWNVARTPEQINSGMRNIIPANALNLHAYFNMDQGVGGNQNYKETFVLDRTVGQQNLTLYNMTLEALNTNWTQSYAMVVPYQLEPTDLTPSGFTLNWEAPAINNVSNYFVDISLSPNFTAPISGSPFTVPFGTNTLEISGLAPSVFYTRIRANKYGMVYTGEGAPSNVKAVKLEYTPPGNALSFDGSNDYGVINKSITGDFTVEYWVKTTQTGPIVANFYQAKGIVDNTCGNSNDFGTALIGDKLAFGVGEKTILSNSIINTGKWYHVAVTRQQSNGQMRLYINGQLEKTDNSHGNAINCGSQITIGSINTQRGSFNNSFFGNIDELRIWNVVRTASQISDYFKDTIDRNTSGLIDYYNFDQGIGDGNNTGLNTLIDISGTNNGGTLTNFALNGGSSNWVKTYIITVNSPGSLTASQTNCSTIELNWILSSPLPTSLCDASVECEPSNFRQQIIADGVMIAEYPFNTTSCVLNVNQIYNGLRLIRGVDYKFYVRTAYVPPLFKYVKYSNVTNPAIGRFKPNPLPPSGFTASDNKCDASIDLSWVWTEANPQNGFVIERGLDSSFLNAITIAVSSDKRSYSNTGLIRGTNYLYRIRARNDCFNPGAQDSMWAGESDTTEPTIGISPNAPERATNIRLFPDSINNVITIRWNDNSNLEEKYTVERSAAGGGYASFETNPNDTFYNDDQASGCVNYYYSVKVYSGCALSGISSIGLNQTRLSPNLTKTFEENTTYKLKGSKGYYSDRIELSWNSRNRSQLSSFRIYRKLASSTQDSILINTVPATSGVYNDLTAQAGLMYRYYIIGEAQCGGITTFSNYTSDIGFRSPAGVITGTVSFDGGFSVEGVRVLAQNTTGVRGSSMEFDGVDDYLVTKHMPSQELSKNNAFTIETWFKPISRRSFVLVSKFDSLDGGFELAYDSASNQLSLSVGNFTSNQKLSVDSPFVSFSSFNQITAIYGADSLKIFVNGILVGSAQNTIGIIGSTQTPIYMGANPNTGVYSKGNLDEIRLYKIAKSNLQVSQDFNRSIENSNANLFVYYTFDDKFTGLTETYDQSNLNLVFNENHASLVNGSNFSDSIPSNSELNLAAYTNANGSYVLNNVRYAGTGQNFTVVPALGIHTFTPNNRILFVGDGAQVVSNIDFTDNSSFEFTGKVVYAGTTCPASGATVYIDNLPAILNNKNVLVNDSGKFTVQVPIGPHVVSLGQTRHEFSQGSFPPNGTYNFLGPVSATFVDSTYLKVVGRVVGGNRELNKAPGLGRSINNIGKAQFTLNSTGQQGLSGCFTKQVITNDSTGEYEVYMLPLRYTIDGLRLVNNPDPTLLTKAAFNNPNVLDLTNAPALVTVHDTLRTELFSRADSVQFNKRLDFKFYETPEIFLTTVETPFDSLVNNFIGEEEVVINESLSIPISASSFQYPIFKEAVYYTGKLKVIEQYINIDKDSTDPTRSDIVPVYGKFRILNNLASSDDGFREVEAQDSAYEYTFRGGIANTLTNSINPEYSYTKSLQIQFIPNAGLTVEYQPNKLDPNSKFYRGVIFGSEMTSSAFTSAGPALVDFVLRDPPGSASSASWTTGKSYTTVDSWSSANSYSVAYEQTIKTGTNIIACACVLGFGKKLDTEIKNDLTYGFNIGTTITNEGELVTTTTSNKTISTGGDPGSVGAGADIYYGKAQNLIYGFTNEVKFMDTATCRIVENENNSQICFGPEINGYRIGKVLGMFLVPGSIVTSFAYTQNEILDIIIPDLERLRNSILSSGGLNAKGQRKYTPNFSDPEDPAFSQKYGSNNDDPIWGALRSSETPFIYEPQDTFGQSYLFWPGYKYEADSVRFYNTQIRLWKNAIARNEREKFLAAGKAATSGGSNISIGKAAYSQDFSTQIDETYTESYELVIGEELALTFGVFANKTGFSNTFTFSFEQTRGKSKSSTTTATNTFAYTLQDGDDGDLISVDIVDPKSGNGHVFKLKAGKTSCPYEGEERSLFYDPDNDTITSSTLLEEGVILQNATAQNDKPVISVQQSSIFNIPAEDEAIFVLELGNLSEGRQDRTYALQINEATNPYGAVIQVDGLSPNREFDVPFGTTLQKTLTLKRGPIQYDYENIQLILSSPCDGDIFDTVSISAKFLPTCTGVALKSPDDRWVLNNSFQDTLPVVIGGYNYNYGGFEAIHLQYKPGSGNTWFTEKSYYKDTADENVKIPIGTPDIYYPFNFKNLPDGTYEIRAVTECIAPGYPNTRVNSSVMQGLADRVNPTPFGTPSPGDGILSPNDDISIQFNEPIDETTLSLSNFEIKGVLNQSDLRSNTSLYFDGNGDYVEVASGLNLQQQPFTIEFWHKRGGLGEQVLFSQGADTGASFEVGFDAENKFYFRIGEEKVYSNQAILDTVSYGFYGVSYSSLAQTADLFRGEQTLNIGNNRIFNPYLGSGKFYMGKSATGTPRYAKGNLYEVRLWGVARSLTTANQSKSKLLSGNESGLLGNWRMDEASGSQVRDYARSRNGYIQNAQWFLSPMGSSMSFDGSGDYLTVPTAHFGISKEMDFTLEFWLKGNGSNTSKGLLGNGKGLSSDENANLKWSIETDSLGRILVRHNGVNFVATNSSYLDNNWHHVAFVLRRSSSLSCYVDGNLQNSLPSYNIEQFGGSKLWVGARGWNNNGNAIFDSTSHYFLGHIDDVRIWNSSRLAEQIGRDKNNRLNGNESGLELYLPFETYEEVMGFPILSASTREITSATRSASLYGNASLSSESPTLKLPRAAQSINFTYGVNSDKIILTPTTANEYIENVTLDITVKNVKDKNGNSMQSPKTWIAYMDRNQVKWQDDERVFSKAAGSTLSFEAIISNTGGALKSFTIGNLPSWLSSDVITSTISPNSSKTITFTIDPTLNIGKYEQDISLSTDFGYDDKLLVKLEVKGIAPSWSVNPQNFSKSMSVIGQVRINNVISANTDDILGAFVNNQCRGIGKVTYYEQMDKYLLFMDVYGVTENEELEFRIWNSATGKIHVEVDPKLNFVNNNLVGSVLAPQVFNAKDKVYQEIAIKPGWNWISFNLLMADSNNLAKLFETVTLSNASILKNNEQLAVYDVNNGWSGNLANFNAGIKPEKSYLFYNTQTDTIILKGVEANPQFRPISIQQGWNYIGYVGQRNLLVNDAFGDFNAKHNDLIKGQVQFAIYDSLMGWIGSLTAMVPGKGYQYYSNGTGTLRYPRLAMFGKTQVEEKLASSAHWKINPYKFQTNMNMVVSVDVCDKVLAEGNLLLGAFVNGELRGFAQAKGVNNNKYLYFLNVAGISDEQISFRLLNESTGITNELNGSFVFEPNLLKGNLVQPVILTPVNKIACETSTPLTISLEAEIYPVPTQTNVMLKVALGIEETISVKVFDLSGKELFSENKGQFVKGNYEIPVHTESLADGVYLVEVSTSKEFKRFKMVKTK
jgi:hypothetical protein